jgi:hypothetical protein
MNIESLTTREILEDLFYSTNGNKWRSNSNWLSDKPYDDWIGLVASGNDILQIKLSSNLLKGKIGMNMP